MQAGFKAVATRGDRNSSSGLDLSLYVGAAALRSLGGCLDSFEGAEHVTLITALPQESAERAPDLGEDVVPEVEDSVTQLRRRPPSETRSATCSRPVAHHDGELENLTGLALGDLARGPIEDGPFSFRFTWPRYSATDVRAGRLADPSASITSGLYSPILVMSLRAPRPCPAGRRCAE